MTKIEYGSGPWVKQKMNCSNTDSITKWIDVHLKGRYFVGTKLVVDESNQMVGKIAIGFENQKELSYFVLVSYYVAIKDIFKYSVLFLDVWKKLNLILLVELSQAIVLKRIN